jgi:hypothetical protein
VVDAAWSRSLLLLTASMDACVRLWHPSRSECLHKFHHPDAVTAVAFHPAEERYFLTGSFDQKLRVWSLETGRVVLWHATATMVTAVAFSPDAQYAVAGLWNGLVVVYHTEGLRYHTVVECRNRKGALRKGRKVTGIEFINGGSQMLVTTNDSRARLISMDDFSQVFKYIGSANTSMQIRCSFDSSGDRIISGSDDGHVVLWRTRHDHYTPTLNPRFTGFQRHKVRSYEYFDPRQGDAELAARTLAAEAAEEGGGGAGAEGGAARTAPGQQHQHHAATTVALFAPVGTVAAVRDWRRRMLGPLGGKAGAGGLDDVGVPDDDEHVHLVLVVADAVGLLRVFESDGPVERV